MGSIKKLMGMIPGMDRLNVSDEDMEVIKVNEDDVVDFIIKHM